MMMMDAVSSPQPRLCAPLPVRPAAAHTTSLLLACQESSDGMAWNKSTMAAAKLAAAMPQQSPSGTLAQQQQQQQQAFQHAYAYSTHLKQQPSPVPPHHYAVSHSQYSYAHHHVATHLQPSQQHHHLHHLQFQPAPVQHLHHAQPQPQPQPPSPFGPSDTASSASPASVQSLSPPPASQSPFGEVPHSKPGAWWRRGVFVVVVGGEVASGLSLSLSLCAFPLSREICLPSPHLSRQIQRDSAGSRAFSHPISFLLREPELLLVRSFVCLFISIPLSLYLYLSNTVRLTVVLSLDADCPSPAVPILALPTLSQLVPDSVLNDSDFSTFLREKCGNRECTNIRGYAEKPKSIYCSARCQSRGTPSRTNTVTIALVSSHLSLSLSLNLACVP